MSGSASNPPPKDNLVRHVAIVGVLTVVFYIAGFWFINVYLRSSKGPWEITFISDADGRPTLQITQAKLHIDEKLQFPNGHAGRSNVTEIVRFRESITNLPFGEMLMQDPLYLPGTITVRLSGHLVEILPRTLIVDHEEYPWNEGQTVTISKTK